MKQTALPGSPNWMHWINQKAKEICKKHSLTIISYDWHLKNHPDISYETKGLYFNTSDHSNNEKAFFILSDLTVIEY